MVALGDRIDGGGVEGLVLAGRHSLHVPAAVGAFDLPIAGFELGLGPQAGIDKAVLVAPVSALAVDRHGGGNDYLAQRMLRIGQQIQEHSTTQGIDLSIILDLVHRLAHTYGGGQVIDDIHPLQRAGQRLAVPHVRLDQLSLRIQVVGHRLIRSVDLRHQAIIDPDPMPTLYQGIHQEGTDEASPPCY